MSGTPAPQPRCVHLISTGGTIEKTYDELTGRLENRRSIVQRMLEQLRLEATVIRSTELLSKDSLDLTDGDRALILSAARDAAQDLERAGASEGRASGRAGGGVVVLHGTDTLEVTGRLLHRELPGLSVPVVLTGAMRPFDMKQSDALQNLTEAIFACGVLAPGVWCVAHGRALAFPGVMKDRERGTFTTAEPL